jgi:uncharacterized protein YjbJ (UPF0337 family)
VAAGYGQLVHAGRIYSYLAGPGGGCSSDSADPRPKSGTLNRQPGVGNFELEKFCAQINSGGIVMNQDQVKGKVKDVAGRIERQAGEWAGDPEKQVDGALKQAEGKLQNAWGNAKDEAKKATGKTKKKNEPAADSDETADGTEVPPLRKIS